MTGDGNIGTFEWDGANRVVAINYTGTTNRTEFSYDGLSRLAKVVEKTGGTINSTSKFVWDGTERCEVRNASDGVTLRLYSRGQYASNTPYFYTRDHLGSVREMFKTDGTIVARYDYDPWGRTTAVINTTKPDANFTGLYRHVGSNLIFAAYRAYDSDLGRWLSRDPIAETGGINLYGYVGNSPVRFVDPLGLDYAMAIGALGLGGEVLGGEEAFGWFGGGNFNPVVDIVLAGTAIGVGGWALWEYLQPAAPLPNRLDAQAKPKDCPRGTVPIDTPEGRNRLPPGVKPHDVKRGFKGEPGGGATDWVGVDPNGNIITAAPDGKAIDNGPPDVNPSK